MRMIRLSMLAAVNVLLRRGTYKKIERPPGKRPMYDPHTNSHRRLPLPHQRANENFNPSVRHYTALHLAKSMLAEKTVL